MSLKIIPILTGHIGSYMNNQVLGRQMGQKVLVPAVAWYIEGAEKKVLVDTGMCDTERANRWHHEGSVQKEGEPIHEALRSRGLKAEDIDIVIFTHLHWDHCANMRRFTRATFIAHEREVEFARDPLPPYYRSYEAPILGITPPFQGVSFQLVDSEAEILPGIRVYPTPGHSPGHQSVLVETDEGPYTIAGDAVFCFENLQGDPAHHLKYLPIGRYVNLFELWDSMEEMAKRSKFVLPGHDSRVFDREVYP